MSDGGAGPPGLEVVVVHVLDGNIVVVDLWSRRLRVVQGHVLASRSGLQPAVVSCTASLQTSHILDGHLAVHPRVFASRFLAAAVTWVAKRVDIGLN